MDIFMGIKVLGKSTLMLWLRELKNKYSSLQNFKFALQNFAEHISVLLPYF